MRPAHLQFSHKDMHPRRRSTQSSEAHRHLNIARCLRLCRSVFDEDAASSDVSARTNPLLAQIERKPTSYDPAAVAGRGSAEVPLPAYAFKAAST